MLSIPLLLLLLLLRRRLVLLLLLLLLLLLILLLLGKRATKPFALSPLWPPAFGIVGIGGRALKRPAAVGL